MTPRRCSIGLKITDVTVAVSILLMHVLRPLLKTNFFLVSCHQRKETSMYHICNLSALSQSYTPTLLHLTRAKSSSLPTISEIFAAEVVPCIGCAYPQACCIRTYMNSPQVAQVLWPPQSLAETFEINDMASNVAHNGRSIFSSAHKMGTWLQLSWNRNLSRRIFPKPNKPAWKWYSQGGARGWQLPPYYHQWDRWLY